MTNYNFLIDTIRKYGRGFLAKDAADAIETLQARAERAEARNEQLRKALSSAIEASDFAAGSADEDGR